MNLRERMGNFSETQRTNLVERAVKTTTQRLYDKKFPNL